MTDRTCVVGNHATTDKLRREMCSRHYRGWWEANRAERCTVDGCTDGQVGRDWCRPHYRHWQRHGHPTVKPEKTPRPVRRCDLPGCEEKHEANGLCHKHSSNAWYHANKVKAKAGQAKYRSRNRERERLRVQAWRCANPGRAEAACRDWYARNRDAVRDYRRSYRNQNREAIRLLNAGRRARKRSAPINDFTARQWHELKTLYRGRCAYCGQRRRLTIDHVQPLAKGGAHTMSNIVPACQSCNSRKCDRAAPTYQPLLM